MTTEDGQFLSKETALEMAAHLTAWATDQNPKETTVEIDSDALQKAYDDGHTAGHEQGLLDAKEGRT